MILATVLPFLHNLPALLVVEKDSFIAPSRAKIFLDKFLAKERMKRVRGRENWFPRGPSRRWSLPMAPANRESDGWKSEPSKPRSAELVQATG